MSESIINANPEAHALRRLRLELLPEPFAPVASANRASDAAPDHASRTAAADGEFLDLPDELGHLRLPADAAVPRPERRSDAAGAGPTYLVEPVARGHELRCLLAAPAGSPVRVNGEQRTHLACLRDGDVVEFDAGRSGRLVLERRSVPGHPPPGLVGRPCRLCNVAFEARTRIWICATCGTALHDETGDEEKALRCRDIGTECPTCRAPIEGPDHEEGG